MVDDNPINEVASTVATSVTLGAISKNKVSSMLSNKLELLLPKAIGWGSGRTILPISLSPT